MPVLQHTRGSVCSPPAAGVLGDLALCSLEHKYSFTIAGSSMHGRREQERKRKKVEEDHASSMFLNISPI
ncbi:hypothetical protein SETIT_5G335100v2 [Setaria italica]|uniref:Uncharacterized protein n=2 Tax=Setaria TaxID=4554 RepID=A0A368RDA3_SETIT|nr:hypothetical protein SETIT_5G335100v2 [Setaria italica]TKW17037.1 hypothetical protein SEVIR_5G339300v2 [Setaria viridis]